MNTRILNEVMDVYEDIKKRIQGDFQNQADAKAAAAQLTTAYFAIAAAPEEEKVTEVSKSTINGGQYGSKYK